jgi:putative transposase
VPGPSEVGFFAWYTTEHRHSGIALFTPADVHYGRSGAMLEVRAGVLAGAYVTHPERFVNGLPLPRAVPAEVWINQPLKEVPQA